MSEEYMKLADLYDKYDNLPEGEVVLDVRGVDEYEAGHIPGSLNIPHTEVTQHVDELKKYNKIYIACRMGGRAQVAFQLLKNQGLKNLVCIPDAGFQQWQEDGMPVKTP